MSQLKEYAVLPQHVVHDNDNRDPELGVYEKVPLDPSSEPQPAAVPSICGLPLKYVS